MFSTSPFKFTALQARLAVAAAILLGSAAADASGFYAYYTRLGFADAPEATLPGRTLTGKYADVVVRLAAGRFVFSREHSYLPYWEVGTSQWLAPEIVARSGDGPSGRPDNINRCSYVRIIESGDTGVVVHWRYAPDLTGNHFTNFTGSYDGDLAKYYQDYVDEYFTITPAGAVTRTVRTAQAKLDAHDSPSNVTHQTFVLTAGGITNLATTPAVPQDTPATAVTGTPLKTPPVGPPALWWKCDDGLSARPLARKYLTQENVNAVDCTISGNTAIWREGVSGTCLEFDGYTSVVTLPGAHAPNVSVGLTMEAWVAPQEYAHNSSAIVDHSGGDANGYSLHMDYLGRLVFRVQTPGGWRTLTTSAQLPLLKWSHVAAVYDPASGLRIYMDGASAGTLAATGTLVDASGTDIRIGMSHKKQSPTSTGRGFAQSFLSTMVFDGLIDEVRIHGRPLAGTEISSNRTALIPSTSQPLQYRVMPSGTPNGTFGASYEKLAYAPAWDNLWRVGDHPDIVVGFDQHPIRMVFWRGTSYGLSTVSENGIWVSDQSPENWTEGPSFAEHMSDKQCRYSHVRLIENSPARVVVHWRVASNMIDYKLLTPNDPWGDWTDEYYTIYPDGVAVRYQEVRANTPGRLGEVLQHEWLNQPGTRPEDNANDQCITVANMNGQTRRYDWSGGSGAVSLDPAIANGGIEYMNLKANYKHYIIGETGSSWSPFGHANPGYSKFSCWNHWPVAPFPSDDRNTLWPDRPSSACAGNLWPVRHNVGAYQQQVVNLYGLTTNSAAGLAPLAKSWAQAPAITAEADCQEATYVTAERAYHLTATGDAPSVRIAASAESPLVNLCLVVKDWTNPADEPARLLIDGVEQPAGANFRQGIVRDTNGNPMLVVWVTRQAAEPVTFTLQAKPSTPTGLTATPGLAAVALNWAHANGASGYKLWQRNTLTGVVQIDTVPAPFRMNTGLDIGTSYEFKVCATNSSGDSEWSGVVSATPTATKGSQTLTFTLGPALAKAWNDPPFADPAVASTGLPVTWSTDNPAVATVDTATGMVTITGIGTAQLSANQAGDAAFLPAPQASQTLTVGKASQTITFNLGLNLSKALSDTPFADTATASSGLPVTYTSDNPAVATVDANTGMVTIMGIGTAHLLADQAGNASYDPAPQVSQTLTVQTELIANGTFEAVSGGNGANATSWTKDGAYGVYNAAGRLPYAGSWSYVPGNGTANVGVYQNLAVPLESGKQYTLSWYQNPWSNSNGLDVIVGVYSGAGARDVAGSYTSVSLDVDVTDPTANTWNLHTYTFTAVGNSTLVYFGTLIGAGANNSADIDNVSLTEVPANAPTSSNDSLTIAEDTPALLATSDFGTYSDPNSVPLAAVKISTLASAGSLAYDTTGAGAWAAVTVDQEISSADITAGRLRFSPAADGNGSPYATIGFRVGNGTLFSIPYTLTVNVTPINDYAPTAANQALVIAQNGSRVLTAVNFGFADADGNDTLQMVKVTQLPAAGSLTLSSVAVTPDQEITVADINAGNLRFTPAASGSGEPYATIGFKVSDGTFYSVASYTLTIDVAPVAVANSANRIPFVSSGTLVGAAVFGNAGTYDGITFSLWNTPFTTPMSLGSGVSVAMAVTGGGGGGGITGTALGTTQQYQFAAFPLSAPRGMTVTFTGLDSAKEYRFQFGYGDFRTIYNYNETVTLASSDSTTATTRLAYGSAAAGDEYALLTATVSNTTSLVLTLPQTVSGYHGPSQGGFSVHQIAPSGYIVAESTNVSTAVVGGNFTFGFNIASGALYHVQASTNLLSPIDNGFTNITSQLTNLPAGTIIYTNTTADQLRMLRILSP